MQQQSQQRVAAALTTREHANLFEDVVFGKQETPEQAAQFGFAGAGRGSADIVDDAGVGIEFLILILRKVVGLDVVAETEFAVGHLLRTGQKFDERGLPRAVYADQGNAVSAFDHEIDVAKDFLFGAAVFAWVRFGHIFELGHDAAAGLGLGKRKVDGLFFRRNLDALDLFQFLDAALHLLGLGGLVAEAVDEDFQLLDAVTLVAVGGLELLVALRLLRQKLVVVAGVKPETLVPDFGDLVDGDVEKIAVVRDQHERVRIVLQIFFEPVAGFEIEMVGRLIEQQQVGLLQKKFREGEAHLPSAGEFVSQAWPVF